jgi:hypothetical protein
MGLMGRSVDRATAGAEVGRVRVSLLQVLQLQMALQSTHILG